MYHDPAGLCQEVCISQLLVVVSLGRGVNETLPLVRARVP